MNGGGLKAFARFIVPVIHALRSVGGSARSAQVKDIVLDALAVPESERDELLKNGVSRLGNQIDWSRFYLAKAGFLDSSKRGVWTLTEKGLSAELSPADVRELVRSVNAAAKSGPMSLVQTVAEPLLPDDVAVDEESTPASLNHRALLLQTLKSLPPKGFEEVCRYLLLESDFEEVTVTGRSNDGGIDGQGVLRVNKLVSMKVLFQCKRYADSVGASVVRDFRGALTGRAEKGIILTTGYFTSAAEQEARRDGVVPIELVDGERLTELFEELEIGLSNPRTIYDVDDSFFAKYRV